MTQGHRKHVAPGPIKILGAVAASLALTSAAAAQSAFGDVSVPRTVDSQAAAFSETRLGVPRSGTILALRDMTGDGRQELLLVDRNVMRVRQLDENGVYEPVGALHAWTTKTVGWDLADIDGDGRTELLTVADGRTLQSRSVSLEGKWMEPVTLVEAATYLPAGIARVAFTRDVDADGRMDIVLPGPGRFHLRLNRGVNPETPGSVTWSAPIEVGYEPDIQYEFGDPSRLSSTFGQSVRVPWFSIRDVDGDGRQDLVSESDDRVAFHLARPQIDALPSWELDLTAFKNDVSASDIDLDDLLSAVSGIAQWRVEDIDGVAPNDLVIGSEGTYKVYLGGAATGPINSPDQVLKASGNVLYSFVRDVIGDERPDLQVVRGERLSLARLLKYLVVPGQLDFDVFTYENEGGAFARRPTKRTTLGLRIPRLFKLFDEFEEVAEELERQWDIPARRIDWDGDGEQDDVVDERNGALAVMLNCAPGEQRFENLTIENGLDGLIESIVLRDLDKLGDGGESVIDIGALDAFAVAPGKALRDATAGEDPVATHPLWEGEDDRTFRGVDLDGDGQLDVVSVVECPTEFRVQFLVRR